MSLVHLNLNAVITILYTVSFFVFIPVCIFSLYVFIKYRKYRVKATIFFISYLIGAVISVLLGNIF